MAWRRTRRIPAIAFLCAAVATLPACNTLFENWSGQPQWTTDAAFVSPQIPGGPHQQWHSESTTVFFNGQYRMYHRYFDPQGGPGNIHIGVSVGATDNSFGSPQIVISRHNLFAQGCSLQYVGAPKADIAPNGLLTLVFEVNPGPAGPCNPFGVSTSIGIAHSWDGVSFFSPRIVIAPERPWEGRSASGFPGNVGTPTIDHTAEGYWITYHGFRGTEPYGSGSLQRGVRFWPTLDPLKIENGVGGVRYPSPMQFVSQNGGPLPGSIYGIGIGAADIEVWHPTSGGEPGVQDGAFYMVLEAFAGSPVCDSQAKTTLAIARATSMAGPWHVQDRVLLGQKQGCGRDMPAWWYDFNERRYKVVFTTENGAGAAADLQRITLVNRFL